MRWAFVVIVSAVLAMFLLSGCAKTGIPECDYKPGKIKGDPVKNCPGTVYFNIKEGKCFVQGAGMGTNCPTSAFAVDKTDLMEACKQSAQSPGDIEYCEFRVGERTVTEALTLCQKTCENLPLN